MTLRAPTHTRISLNLSFDKLVPEYAKLPCDGVGVLPGEFLALSLGIHPRKLLADRNEEKFLDFFSQNILGVTRDFAPRPVVYRTLDLKSNEYAGLKGGADWKEDSLRDLRGCGRYLADEASFRLELRAVKRARDMGCVNLDVIFPFVQSPEELARCREIVIDEGLFASAEFELWMMAEAPSNAPRIGEFLPYVSGVAMNPQELARAVPGMDGGSRGAAKQVEGRDPEVLATLTVIAQACRERGVACSICGEALSHDPEMIRALIEAGLMGLSVAPESLGETIAAVGAAEAALGISPERELPI
jgi:pyruvate,water dikinase